MTAMLRLAASLAAEQQLRYRSAMEGLLEPNIESADPATHQKPVKTRRHIDRVPDDDFDMLQDEAENSFYQEMQEGRQHSEGHSARQAW